MVDLDFWGNNKMRLFQQTSEEKQIEALAVRYLLIKSLEDMSKNHPSLRLGQLLTCCLEEKDSLFTIPDERLIDRLLVLDTKLTKASRAQCEKE